VDLGRQPPRKRAVGKLCERDGASKPTENGEANRRTSGSRAQGQQTGITAPGDDGVGGPEAR